MFTIRVKFKFQILLINYPIKLRNLYNNYHRFAENFASIELAYTENLTCMNCLVTVQAARL